MKGNSIGNRVLTIFILLSLFLSFSPTGLTPTSASQSSIKPIQQDISPDVLARLGISHPTGADMTQLSQQVAQQVQQSGLLAKPEATTSGGLPTNLNLSLRLSAAGYHHSEWRWSFQRGRPDG